MADEIVSLAILEALPGKEEELVAMLRELYTLMHTRDTAATRFIATLPVLTASFTPAIGNRKRRAPRRSTILRCIVIGCNCRSCAPFLRCTRAWRRSSKPKLQFTQPERESPFFLPPPEALGSLKLPYSSK